MQSHLTQVSRPPMAVPPPASSSDELTIGPETASKTTNSSCASPRVKQLGTDDAFTLSAVGFTLFYSEVDYDTGIDMVERAVRSNPNYGPAYNSRAFLRVWDGGSDTAVADFE